MPNETPTLTVRDLALAFAQFEKEASDRGFSRPEMYVSVHSGQVFIYCKLFIGIDHSNSKTYGENVPPEKEPDFLAQCMDWLRDLETPEELRRKSVVEKVGRLIDEARDLDMDVDFLHPLEESMKALSENVIEHKAA